MPGRCIDAFVANEIVSCSADWWGIGCIIEDREYAVSIVVSFGEVSVTICGEVYPCGLV